MMAMPIAHLAVVAFVLFQRRLGLDELMHWLATRSASSPLQLLETTKYHGRPPLFHLLIWPLVRTFPAPDAIKVAILILALMTSGLLLRFARQINSAKVLLLLFTPFMSIGYFGMTREYALMTLLAVICATTSPVTSPTMFLLAAAGLALTNVFGIMLSVAFMAYYGAHLLESSSDASIRTRRVAPFLVVSSIAIGLWLSRPRQEGQKLLGTQSGYDSWDLHLRRAVLSFLGETMTGRNQDPTRAIRLDEVLFFCGVVVVVSIVAAVSALVSTPVLIFLVTGLALGTTNAVLGYSRHWWHWGYFYVVVTVSLVFIIDVTSRATHQLSRAIGTLVIAFSFLSFLTLPLLPMTKYLTSERPDTRAKDVATWIELNCQLPCIPVVSSELPGGSVSAELGGRELFYVNRQDFGTYALLTRTNMVTEVTWDQIVTATRRFSSFTVIVQSEAVSGTAPSQLEEVARFEDALNPWGRYLIYRPAP
jgi:hypothetical protein